jgi:hypothetical protein
MLTSLPALKAVTILCNVFLSALTIFPFSDGFELVLILYKDAIVGGLFWLMGVRSGILGDCFSSFNTSRSLIKNLLAASVQSF